ncbi:hypothetical protein Tco_0406863 [Tanacetum coccineum]
MNVELVKGSKTKGEGSSKRAGYELKSDKSKKQKIDEHIEILQAGGELWKIWSKISKDEDLLKKIKITKDIS